MTSILYYLFQVMLCSAILMAYYALVLRDKKFHQYNRFYLMAVIVLSWTVPLIEINWAGQGQGQVSEVVNFIALQNAQWKQTPSTQWSGMAILGTLVYATVGLFLLAKMLRAYVQLLQLQKQHAHTVVGKIKFFQTDLGEAPFSFFNAIFWNRAIDPQTTTGQKMMAHELTHVREKHSVDKMLLQANRALGWFNPFFWLLAKEMDMVHEFIADQKAVAQGDAATLAEMLLAAAQPGRFFGLTHPFFFSPIQRRLKMIASQNKTPFSYMRRIIALPLLAIVLVLVSFRHHDPKTANRLSLSTVMENLAAPVLAATHTKDTIVLNADSVYVMPAGKKVKIISPDGEKKKGTTVFISEKGGAELAFVGVEDLKVSERPLSIKTNGLEPLYVLDGVKVAGEKWKTLNPNDIAMVNVKKGSANEVVVWGEEAKNGVVEITTKAYAKANKVNVKEIPVEGHPFPGAEGRPVSVVSQPKNGPEAPSAKVVQGQPIKVVEGRPIKVVEGRPLNMSHAEILSADSLDQVQRGEVVEVMGYALPKAPKVVDKTTLVLNGRVITWKDLEAMPADRIAGIKIEKGTGGAAKKIIILEKAPTKIEVKEMRAKEQMAPPPPPPPAKKKN